METEREKEKGRDKGRDKEEEKKKEKKKEKGTQGYQSALTRMGLEQPDNPKPPPLPTYIHAAYSISASYFTLSFDPDNAVWLCGGVVQGGIDINVNEYEYEFCGFNDGCHRGF